jgi:hypothetical protein
MWFTKNGAKTRDSTKRVLVVLEIGFLCAENNFVPFRSWGRVVGYTCFWNGLLLVLSLLTTNGLNLCVVVFHAATMLQSWIHQLTKQQVEELSSQMGLPTNGTLDELRKWVKDKWTAIEVYLPSQSADKLSPSMTSLPQRSDATVYRGNYFAKIQIKLVTDLISAIPVLSNTHPEQILEFLIRARHVFELRLISDSEFMALLVSRTSGRITQILGAHLGTTEDWGVVQSEIIATFLPPRVKERFLASYVLDRFQSSGEDLNTHVMSVVAAADILGFVGSESQLVHRIVKNLHPTVKSYFLFETKPESIRDLFLLAPTVAEAVAVENQRELLTAPIRQNDAPCPMANVVIRDRPRAAKAHGRTRCWGCGVLGHLERDCPSGSHQGRALSNLR